ncbi:hypothetical protein QTN25_004350 [Entamoeba marina]
MVQLLGVIFEENSILTFDGGWILNFDFGNFVYYEFRQNSIINYNGGITFNNPIVISNSFTLNVYGNELNVNSLVNLYDSSSLEISYLLRISQNASLSVFDSSITVNNGAWFSSKGLFTNSTLKFNGYVTVLSKGSLEISNSKVTLSSHLDLYSKCKIINSIVDIGSNVQIFSGVSLSFYESTIRVNGPIWNSGTISIENSILNVYQYNDYSKYKDVISDNKLGIILLSYSSLVMSNNAEVNIYGSSYTDNSNYFTASTYGLSTKESTKVTLINSKISVISLINSNYTIGITIDDSAENVASLKMTNNSVISTPFFKQVNGYLIINDESTIYIFKMVNAH